MQLSDFYEHPHDRGELTMTEIAALYRDYAAAGSPDDIVHFLATTPPWRDLPAYVFQRTFEALIHRSELT